MSWKERRNKNGVVVKCLQCNIDFKAWPAENACRIDYRIKNRKTA